MKHLLLLVYFLSIALYAQDDAFNPEKSKGALYEYAEYAEAGNNKLSLKSITQDLQIQFKPLESSNQSVGFTSNYYWIRFKLQNTTNESKTYYLETARPITDIADLYVINDNKVHLYKSGDQIGFEERQVDHRSTIFKIQVPKQCTTQFYIHLKSDGETLNLPLNLYDQGAFWKMNYNQQLFLGIFYGLLFLGGLIYLFFFFSLKKKTFLYYGFYVFSIALLQAALDGFIYQYILPQGGYLNSRAVLITALLSNFFLLKYCEHFLKTYTYLPKYNRLFNAIYIAIAIVFVMVFVSPTTLELAYPISNLNGLFSLILILTTIFVLRLTRISIDVFFSVGIFFLVIGLLGFVMNNLSLLPNNFYTLNSAKFGSGFEVIFLSLSMTNLIRKLRMEKERSQEEALQKSEEISGLKTYFMSNISHELRTPINAIMGIAEAQLNEANNKGEHENYEIIKNASLSLLSNVNDIIDFEKIEKNALVLKQEEFSPLPVLTQMSDNWKREAEKKGLYFKFEKEGVLPIKIIGDSERFLQIINNILSNAIKFTLKGGVTFKVDCKPYPNNTYKFLLRISDTGVGINGENQKYVFDSFNQMRLNHKRQFGGVGLGLTIVKHIVELFNGNIKIKSSEDIGTEVSIELYVQGVEKAIQKDLEFVEQEKNNVAWHVLVVEDNRLNQMVMRKLLSGKPEISFTLANDGSEALEALKEGDYNIILMDLQMPVMDGYEATQIIRGGELGAVISKIPIIAITADAMEETRKRVLEIGMNDYMTKPVNRELLFEKINKLIQ